MPVYREGEDKRMFPRARLRSGAEEALEDEEAFLVKQRDLTLRSALDQIQQRRRAPRLSSPPPPSRPPEGGEKAAPAVPLTPPPPPHPQGNPLEALRQREWLLNLQEQQELERLRAALTSKSPQRECPQDKEEQLLFNGESPPSPPPPTPPREKEVPPASPPPPPLSSPARPAAGGGGRGGCRGRASRRGGRGGRGGSRGFHWGGWLPSYQQHRREGMAYSYGHRPPHTRSWQAPRSEPSTSGTRLACGPSPLRPERGELATSGAAGSSGQPGKRERASSHRSLQSSSQPDPPADPGDWQEQAQPRSEQDEASMLAQALELSRLEDVPRPPSPSCVEEKQPCATVPEQARREPRKGGRRGARGRRASPPKARPPAPPEGDLLSLGRQLGKVVGSIDVHHPSDGAEGDVSFDQWLSLCTRYMPLLAQGMVELQRTCAAVRSVVPLPAFDGHHPIPFPPPGWPHFPPPALTHPPPPLPPGLRLGGTPGDKGGGPDCRAHGAPTLLGTPPAALPPSAPVPPVPPAPPLPPAPPMAALIAELTGPALRANHYGQLPRPPPVSHGVSSSRRGRCRRRRRGAAGSMNGPTSQPIQAQDIGKASETVHGGNSGCEPRVLPPDDHGPARSRPARHQLQVANGGGDGASRALGDAGDPHHKGSAHQPSSHTAKRQPATQANSRGRRSQRSGRRRKPAAGWQDGRPHCL